MVGGVLALVAAPDRQGSRIFPAVLFLAGLALIGGSIFLLNPRSPFPGINALWPCLGAALVIWSGGVPHPGSRLLANRFMVFVGLISYSLYLWHWPIIAFLNYGNIAISPLLAVAVFFGSILLAWLSWRFVETPLRRSGTALPFSRVFVWRFAIPGATLVCVVAAIVWLRGIPNRFDPRVAAFERVLDARPEVLRAGCHVPSARSTTLPDPARCRFGATKPELDGILIGDSFANHFTGMLDVMAKDAGISLMDYTMDGCPPILGYSPDSSATYYATRCRERNAAVFALLSAKPFGRVVLAGDWPREPEVEPLLAASIEAVLRTGANLTLILNNESINRADSCPIRVLMYHQNSTCAGPRQGPPAYFARLRSRFPQVTFIDPNQVICRGSKCSPVIGDTPLYRDSGHLNDVGSRLIGQALLRMGVTL